MADTTLTALDRDHCMRLLREMLRIRRFEENAPNSIARVKFEAFSISMWAKRP